MGLKSACAKLRLPQLTKKWGLQRGDSFHFEASICFSAFRSFWSVLKLLTWTVSELWISQVSIFWINTYQLQIDQQNLPMIKHKHKPTFSQDDWLYTINLVGLLLRVSSITELFTHLCRYQHVKNYFFSSKVTNTELHDSQILTQVMEGSGKEKAKSTHLFLLYWSPAMTVTTALMVTPCTYSTVSEEDSQWLELQKHHPLFLNPLKAVI